MLIVLLEYETLEFVQTKKYTQIACIASFARILMLRPLGCDLGCS